MKLLRLTTTRQGSTSASSSAFTRSSLDELRARLDPIPSVEPFRAPAHTVEFAKRPASEAAVLIPLLNIGQQPHVLMELRSSGLRTHAGEISFPGGKIDSTDRTIVDAALRETYEELRIPPENIEILGQLESPEYSLGNRSRVWPVVGFIHSSTPWPTSLTSLALSSIHPSPDEVAGIIPFPLSALHDMSRQRLHHFRVDSRKPYWKYRAGDLVHADGAEVDEEIEVWGLTGWLLNRLAWGAGWTTRPEPEKHDD